MGSMSSDVTNMRAVLANGEFLNTSASENPEVFNAMRNGLGALGVVTKMTMQARNSYHLREDSWMMNIDDAFEQMDSLRDNNRHFEMFALPHADYMLALTLNEHEGELPEPKESTGDAYETFRTLAKVIDYVPFMRRFIVNAGASTVSPEDRTGRSHDILGNLRDMRFNEMEYSVPAEHGPACLKEILDMIKKENIDVIFPIEYRYIKGDDIWLSPFYQRDSASISCHNFHDRDYKKYFARCEAIFHKYDGRPHWGKVNTLTNQEFAGRYDRWDDFKKVRAELDPQGKFLNKYLKEALGVS
jgi:FAD/FMN-containing dehydrogenase